MAALIRFVLGGTVAAAVLLGSTPVIVEAQRDSSQPLSRFRQQVSEYMALKARVAATVPSRSGTHTFEQFVEANRRLREALRQARKDAAIGDMFTEDARPVLRDLIAETLAEHGIDVGDLLADMKADRLPGAAPVRLNEPFAWQRGFIMAPCLLEALPGLPRDLEYRLDARNLVLVDMDVNLVLDILERALPRRVP